MLFGETVAVYCENHTEHINSVRTSQETHYVSAIKLNRLMLFRETVAVYCATIRSPQMHCVGRMQKYCAHIVTTGLCGVVCECISFFYIAKVITNTVIGGEG
jgi:hypothetical protein